MAAPSVTVLVPPVELTEATLPEFEKVLMAHVSEPGPGLVIDLDEVEFISSSGLGVLVKVGMRLAARGRGLAFARPQRTTEHSLTLLGLDRMMPLFPTVEAASTHVTRAASAKIR